MLISTRRAFTSLSLLVAAMAATACGSGFGTETDNSAAAPAPSTGPTRGEDATKAPPITETPDVSEINETLGVFVALTGRPENTGTREQPLKTIQAGIDLGKKTGKRVYVCSGTFPESLTLADSISIIGGLDCTKSEWKTGGARTRIEAPSSPAVEAKNLASPTRLEGLDIAGRNATEAGGSSIGLFSVESAGLVIVGSHIEAGKGATGADGVEGVQLVQTGTLNGVNGRDQTDACFGVACGKLAFNATPGGSSICTGAANQNGESGGAGGSGGLYEYNASNVWVPYLSQPALAPEVRTNGVVSAAGTNGTSATAATALSAEGFAPANGVAGGHGAPGRGGRGGSGIQVTKSNPDLFEGRNPIWFGRSGAGAGAGGCPGLAGTPGGGGGASIAVLVIGAPITIEKSELLAHDGGAGGRGTFGSSPTKGGNPGINYSNIPLGAGSYGFPGACLESAAAAQAVLPSPSRTRA